MIIQFTCVNIFIYKKNESNYRGKKLVLFQFVNKFENNICDIYFKIEMQSKPFISYCSHKLEVIIFMEILCK